MKNTDGKKGDFVYNGKVEVELLRERPFNTDKKEENFDNGKR